MDSNFIFPFTQILNDNDYLDAIWNSYNDKDNLTTLNNSSHLDLFDNKDFYNPPNWDPLSCKYITTDKLTERKSIINQFTITQVNARGLKRNLQPLKSYLNSFSTLPHVVTVVKTWLQDD